MTHSNCLTQKKPPHTRERPTPNAKLKKRKRETAAGGRPGVKIKSESTKPPLPRDGRNQTQSLKIKNETAEDAIEARCDTRPRNARPNPLSEALCTKGASSPAGTCIVLVLPLTVRSFRLIGVRYFGDYLVGGGVSRNKARLSL